MEPTSEPTADPTEIPTAAPSGSPTRVPTKGPTTGPTKYPTKTPTKSPTDDPTRGPTQHPSSAPSLAPSFSPTDSPLSLKQILREVDDESILDESTDAVLYTVITVGAVIIIVAVLYRYCKVKRWRNRLVVDNQNLSAVVIFLAQIVDFYSDIVFAIELNRYYNYSTDDGEDLVARKDQRQLFWLYTAAIVFVVCKSI